MGATKLVTVVFSYENYTEMRRIAKDNDIALSELVRRCCEIGLKKIGGKGRDTKE